MPALRGGDVLLRPRTTVHGYGRPAGRLLGMRIDRTDGRVVALIVDVTQAGQERPVLAPAAKIDRLDESVARLRCRPARLRRYQRAERHGTHPDDLATLGPDTPGSDDNPDRSHIGTVHLLTDRARRLRCRTHHRRDPPLDWRPAQQGGLR